MSSSKSASTIKVVVALIWLECLLERPAAYPASSNSLRDMDICNHWNGRRQFLELGERGELHARNVTTTSTVYRSSTLFNVNGNRSSNVAGDIGTSGADSGNRKNYFNARNEVWYQQCNLELVTCAECVIRITFTYVNFSRSCGSDISNGQLPICPCDYLQFSEPPYESISTQQFCGDGKVFRTKTRTLLLKFFYRATAGHVFSLQYFSERNVQIISGSPKQSILSGARAAPPPAHIISTPFFPHTYPRDYGVENILTCEAENCHVRLDFSDFQLGLQSTLEIFDSNGQMLDSYTGEHFRPPITMSSGKSLLLQFRGNGASGAGFRAEISFMSNKPIKADQLTPYTDCGGLVTGPGGAITMMNMSANSTDLRMYDCIWLIKPGNNYMMMKTHISLRVQEFSGLASRSELCIRQGSTSESPLLECLNWPPSGPGGSASETDKDGHVVPVLDGYYIRLRGVFGMSSKLAIVYSVFNYLNCYIGSEFLCGNNHCIAIRLHCDGFDHCGDNSDEPDSCETDWAHLHNDRRWYSHKPNFYFPKIEQYPDLKTATGIFIISTLGIFALLTGWMVVLYRMGVRARQQRELQNHLQTISEFLEDRQDELPPDEPPSYEAPPDYDEVIKVGMEQELREPCTGRQQQHQQRRHHRHHHRHRDRSCSRVASSVTLQSTLNTQCIHNGSDLEGAAAAVASTSNDAAAEYNMQMLANRVLMASGACGASCSFAPSSTSAAIAATAALSSTPAAMLMREATDGSICCAYRTVGVATSPITPPTLSSTGCELLSHNDVAGAAVNNTTERSDEFRDDSLNISFSLAMPTNDDCLTSAASSAATLATSSSLINNSNCNMDLIHARGNNNCTEQTYLKRSWIVMNASSTQSYKMQRLRHTFSSPEAIAADEPFGSDYTSYGTNLPQERNFLPSKLSNFAAELPRDLSTQSFTPPQPAPVFEVCRCACQLHGVNNRHVMKTINNHNNNANVQQQPKSSGAIAAPNGTSNLNEGDDGTDQRQHLLLSEMDSDCENREISCFGAVNKPQFRIGGGGGSSGGGASNGGKTRSAHVVWPRRHVRSKSFTSSTPQSPPQPSPDQKQQQQQSSEQPQREAQTRAIQRSSSADLLMCLGSNSSTRRERIANSDSDGARMFLI